MAGVRFACDASVMPVILLTRLLQAFQYATFPNHYRQVITPSAEAMREKYESLFLVPIFQLLASIGSSKVTNYDGYSNVTASSGLDVCHAWLEIQNMQRCHGTMGCGIRLRKQCRNGVHACKSKLRSFPFWLPDAVLCLQEPAACTI